MDFLRGFLIGFSIAAVLGPIGVLCVRRTLARGFLHGFVSGLGAASADACYAAIAAFGVSAVATLLVDQRMWLRLVGGLFLVYLGVKTIRSVPAQRAASGASARGLAGAYASTLALTLSNPTTILSFVGIFAGLSVGAFDGGSAVVLGVFVGSSVWWLMLAGVINAFRGRVTPRVFRAVNVASGLLILAFGAQALQAGGQSLINLW
jgi:threonine/homoserine/homoserine lactone efflux protein